MIKVPVIYEDEDVMAVNKPVGVISYELENDDLKLAHRLDSDTSGVLLLAKNKNALEFLREQFRARKVKKTYLALVYGVVKNNNGIINTPIGRSSRDVRKKSTTPTARGRMRDAVTEFKVLKRFQNYTLCEARPRTGRTHQIRVHLKSIGHPVVCDKLYASNRPCPTFLKRQALHANSIEFELPSSGRIKLEADLPADMSYDKLAGYGRQRKN